MLNRLAALVASALLFAPGAIAAPSAAPQSDAPCTAEGLAAAVDSAGAELRAFTAENQPKLREKLTQLRDKRKWPEENYEEKGLEAIHDAKITEFDTKVDDYLTKIDTLGRPDDATKVSCASIAELKAAASELMSVVRVKSAYMSEKLDREIKGDTQTKDPAASPSAGPRPPEKPSAWSTRTVEVAPKDIAPPAAPVPPAATTPNPITDPEPYPAPSETFVGSAEEGYSIDEIREATKGFFGTISTSLGSVIEHAFETSGRPTAYVLGNEGGGAFLAGLRYGEGMLYLRSGGTQKVYWHGPSIGYDVGAEGSRTLFLVYRLNDAKEIYRQYTGLDGSAYLVGGVGITLLKGGDVLMAPIRSGLGLRLGANVGYVRFTPRPTWNPF